MQGTGLGMAITKSIVELMGGTIEVSSEVNRGSLFRVELELRIQEAADRQFWVERDISRILSVVGSTEGRENIPALMQDTGVRVDTAVMEEALDLPGTKVLMKSGRALPQVLEALESRGLLESSAMVQNCGLPGEQAAESLKDAPQSGSYFTTLLVP